MFNVSKMRIILKYVSKILKKEAQILPTFSNTFNQKVFLIN